MPPPNRRDGPRRRFPTTTDPPERGACHRAGAGREVAGASPDAGTYRGRRLASCR